MYIVQPYRAARLDAGKAGKVSCLQRGVCVIATSPAITSMFFQCRNTTSANSPFIDPSYLRALLTILPSLSILPHHRSSLPPSSARHSSLYQEPSTPRSDHFAVSSNLLRYSLAARSEISIYAKCLASFTDWSHASPTPGDLAGAGLSYKSTSKEQTMRYARDARSIHAIRRKDKQREIQGHPLNPTLCMMGRRYQISSSSAAIRFS